VLAKRAMFARRRSPNTPPADDPLTATTPVHPVYAFAWTNHAMPCSFRRSGEGVGFPVAHLTRFRCKPAMVSTARAVAARTNGEAAGTSIGGGIFAIAIAKGY
jgi:hypothetical protein